MNKLILFILLITFSILAQDKPQQPILLEHNSILRDSVQIEVFSYRIPYSNILFTKKENEFSSSFVFTVEFYKDNNFVKREILNPTLKVKNYDETNAKDKFYQDYFEVELKPGEYELRSILSLSSTDVEYKLPEQNIKVISLHNSDAIGPLIVNDLGDNKNTNIFVLSNYGNKIPYSPGKYSLLVGLTNTFNDTIKVEINQLGKTIFSKTVISTLSGNVLISKKNDAIYLTIADSSDINYFIISDFSHNLYEGSAELVVMHDSSTAKFNLQTVWFSKPNILNNSEYSIKLLSYIENEEIVGQLLSSSQDDYSKNLTEYWIEKYPSNGMKFNYAMEEFYSRADYALKNYSSLNSMDGAERDRGKIYILYGPPSSVSRNYTEMNDVIEVWEYENLNKRFIFKDFNGTGKFDLSE